MPRELPCVPCPGKQEDGEAGGQRPGAGWGQLGRIQRLQGTAPSYGSRCAGGVPVHPRTWLVAGGDSAGCHGAALLTGGPGSQ